MNQRRQSFEPRLLLLFAASALAGCGASSNSAPIVYGTQPSTTARVYNSPADVYLGQETVAQTTASASSRQPYEAAYQPVNISRQPATLTPVTQTYYEQPARRPAPIFVAETTPTVSATSSAYDPAPRYITVAAGDTVYGIARRTGVSPKAIIAENRLSPPFALSIGQTLRLPIGEPGPSASLQAVHASGDHYVRRGDTLYSISRQTGISVSALASANRLYPPYRLSVGQRIVLPNGATTPATQHNGPQNVASLARTVSYETPARSEPTSLFAWPLKGAVIGRYGSGGLGRRNEGVNIAAPVGTPVRAAADGEVVYRGSEVDGYGNLLLIKHDDDFVTAYAHNDVLLVRKGQKVRQGQVIAKVGQSGDAGEPQLHFEIRQKLKSVDPLALLD